MLPDIEEMKKKYTEHRKRTLELASARVFASYHITDTIAELTELKNTLLNPDEDDIMELEQSGRLYVSIGDLKYASIALCYHYPEIGNDTMKTELDAELYRFIKTDDVKQFCEEFMNTFERLGYKFKIYLFGFGVSTMGCLYYEC